MKPEPLEELPRRPRGFMVCPWFFRNGGNRWQTICVAKFVVLGGLLDRCSGNFNPSGFALLGFALFFFNLAGRLEENMLNYLMPQLVQNDKNMI